MCDECDNRDGRCYCTDCGAPICLEPTDLVFQSRAVRLDESLFCQPCAAEYDIPAPERLSRLQKIADRWDEWKERNKTK